MKTSAILETPYSNLWPFKYDWHKDYLHFRSLVKNKNEHVLLLTFQDLVELFNFHNYDNLRHFAKKYDPRREGGDQRVRTCNDTLWGTNSRSPHQTLTSNLSKRTRGAVVTVAFTAASVLHQLLSNTLISITPHIDISIHKYTDAHLVVENTTFSSSLFEWAAGDGTFLCSLFPSSSQ